MQKFKNTFLNKQSKEKLERKLENFEKTPKTQHTKIYGISYSHA